MKKKRKVNNKSFVKQNNPKLSITLTTYNLDKYVEKALESIPKQKDIELIICDDCSQDNTVNIVKNFIDNNKSLFYNIIFLQNEENKGVGYTLNRCYDAATGDYITSLDSDDYYYTDNFIDIIKEIDGITDIIYFNLQDNNGTVYDLSPETKTSLVGQVKLIRREFMNDIRCPEVRICEDWGFTSKLYAKNPTEKYTHIIGRHYNYPRTGSLLDIRKRQNEIINAISVIIPVCNRAENTKKVLDELLYQKNHYYPETEIIVIENGSTEDMSFLDEYKDIVLKHESATGVSNARNVGLDLARGEYIAFIDNDDFIAQDYLHLLYQTMRQTNCDWCIFPNYVDGVLKFNYDMIDMNNPTKTCWLVWNYCFNRRIIRDKRFDVNLKVKEDIKWIPTVITPETKGAKIEKPLYYYTWDGNEDSLSHKFNIKI